METRNSVFSTLTFPRDINSRDTWLSINVASNRYVQRVRRATDYCEYLKAYEIHKDGYPHIHILFLFRNLNYPYNNTRWLPDNLFAKLKSAWTLGLSDHQSPLANSDYSALKYILKYVSKSTSASHLWSLLLVPSTDYSPLLNDNGYPITSSKYASYHTLLVAKSSLLDRTLLRQRKIKLISWSRGFVQSYLNTLKINEPCPNAPNLHK